MPSVSRHMLIVSSAVDCLSAANRQDDYIVLWRYDVTLFSWQEAEGQGCRSGGKIWYIYIAHAVTWWTL